MNRAALSLIVALVACNGEPDLTTPEQTPPPDPTIVLDEVAPSVVSFSPADGAAGVAADAVVTVVFSEAMDPESVEAALDTSALGAVSLSWNAAQDTLTIDPMASL